VFEEEGIDFLDLIEDGCVPGWGQGAQLNVHKVITREAHGSQAALHGLQGGPCLHIFDIIMICIGQTKIKTRRILDGQKDKRKKKGEENEFKKGHYWKMS